MSANPHTFSEDLVQAPDLPPDDRVYYSEVREREDHSVRQKWHLLYVIINILHSGVCTVVLFLQVLVTSAANYIYPGDRHYSLDPTEGTGLSTSVRSQRLEQDDFTNLKVSVFLRLQLFCDYGCLKIPILGRTFFRQD